MSWGASEAFAFLLTGGLRAEGAFGFEALCVCATIFRVSFEAGPARGGISGCASKNFGLSTVLFVSFLTYFRSGGAFLILCDSSDHKQSEER